MVPVTTARDEWRRRRRERGGFSSRVSDPSLATAALNRALAPPGRALGAPLVQPRPRRLPVLAAARTRARRRSALSVHTREMYSVCDYMVIGVPVSTFKLGLMLI